TFAALVPAQMFLRVAPDGVSLREGWHRHGRRALALSWTLLFPLVHFIYFKRNWHAGQYVTGCPTLTQLRRIVAGLFGAISTDFAGTGLALAILAQVITQRQEGSSNGPSRTRWRLATWFTELLHAYRAALGAGALLVLGGVALYLPMDAISGRYTIPAVWGL